MVFLSLTSRLNKIAGPFLLRCGLMGRYMLGGGSGLIRDNPTLDAILLLPLSQKLVSLEVQDDAVRDMRRGGSEPSKFEKFSERVFDRLFGKDPQQEKEKGRDTSSKNQRLKALETYLRPVLAPNERWSDVSRWHFNSRFLKWARTEFLIAKYGSSVTEILRKNPKLELAPLLTSKKSVLEVLQRTKDEGSSGRMVPPSSRMITKAFSTEHWNKTKDTEAEWRRMRDLAKQLGGDVFEVPGSTLRIADIPSEADLSGLSLEDLLEVTGGHVASCGPLNALCEDAGIYELWTKDFVQSLASYLLDRSEKFPGNTVVLDVGAGDGLLAHFLRDYVYVEAKHRLSKEQAISYAIKKTRKRGSKRLIEPDLSKLPQVVAIDDGSWNIEAKASVEKLNVSDALQKYAGGPEQQLIVLCSWMPMGQDWTAEFRAAGASEYILIGECDNGVCGDNWDTWGVADYVIEQENPCDLDDDSRIRVETVVASFESDGFQRTDLDNMSHHHFSRFDSFVSKNSRTVTFRRTGA